MESLKVGAVTFKSKTAAVKARLLQVAKQKKQGNVSMSDIARTYGVTSALVSQIKHQLIKGGVSFENYDINKHRGRPAGVKA